MSYASELRDARTADPNRAGFAIAGEPSDDGGFLYVPGELLVSAQAAPLLPSLADPDHLELTDTSPGFSAIGVRWFRYTGPEPLLGHIASLQAEAKAAAVTAGQDPGSCRVTPHHVMSGEPWIYKGGPGGELRASEPWGSGPLPIPAAGPHVAVLDTGIPTETPAGLYGALDVDPETDVDHLWPPGQDHGPDFGAQAGHGAFIVGIVNRMTNAHAGIVSLRVLDTDGYGTEEMVVGGLHRLQQSHPGIGVINLSLGTYTSDDLPPLGVSEALAAWDPATTVVVAAAGNAGVAGRPYWPAAMDTVIGVAAIEWQNGAAVRAEFSNSGPWVDVCTDGVSVLSLHSFGHVPYGPGSYDQMNGWARWSGTSFAAPLVAAEIARLVVDASMTPRAALEQLLSGAPIATAVSPMLEGLGRLYDPRQSAGTDPTAP